METRRGAANPLTAEERTMILAMATAGESVRSIATKVGRSTATVSRCAAAEGVVFARTERTRAATEARVARMAHERAERAEELLTHGLTLAYSRFADAATDGTMMDVRNAAFALEKITAAHQRLVETGSRYAVPAEFGGLPVRENANRGMLHKLGQKLIEMSGYSGDVADNPYALIDSAPDPEPLPDPVPEPAPLPAPEPPNLFRTCPADSDPDLGALLKAVHDLDPKENGS